MRIWMWIKEEGKEELKGRGKERGQGNNSWETRAYFIQYYTLQHNIIQYNTIHYNIIQYCSTFHPSDKFEEKREERRVEKGGDTEQGWRQMGKYREGEIVTHRWRTHKKTLIWIILEINKKHHARVYWIEYMNTYQ